VSGTSLPPERLVCDTSFVAASAKRAARPEQFAHWPTNMIARIDVAILAVSVITLAEARYGYLNASWGVPRIEREERRLAGFLQIPLDLAVVDEWARLKVLSRQNGWNLADNDLWIAATASARGHALVTCDADQARIDDPSLDVLHLRVAA
jgi:predicted nucleic acid-binding protein